MLSYSVDLTVEDIMKRDIFKGHLFLLILILLNLSSGLISQFIPEFWLGITSQFLFLGIPVFIYLIVRKKNVVRTLRLNPISMKDMLTMILVALVMQPAVYLLASLAQVIFGNQLEFLFADLVDQPFWYLIITIAISPAIFEELVLRGVIMDAYRGQTMYTVILMNGLLFGLFHMNLNQFVYTFFIGTVMALSVYYTNSIFSGMIIHFVNNFLSIFVMSYPSSWYSKFEMWLFALESPLDIVKFIVFGTVSFLMTFRIVNAMGRRNRKLYLHDASIMSYEKILNWPLMALTAIFLVISIVLTVTIPNL